MDRRIFTKKCLMCLSAPLIIPALTGCQTTRYITGNLEANGISIPKSEFNFQQKGQPMARQYVIVKNNALEFPIYVFRFSETEYSAVWMKCTHQGNELTASGDHLTCSAHGSEFDNKGQVVEGPAAQNLRSFNVSVMGENLFIDLRA